MDLDAGRIAEAVGGRLVGGDPKTPGPKRAVIDSREVGNDDLFVGLKGEHVDGSVFAEAALDAGAWGVLVGADGPRPTARDRTPVIAAGDPLRALQLLAREWRRELGCPVIGVTGST